MRLADYVKPEEVNPPDQRGGGEGVPAASDGVPAASVADGMHCPIGCARRTALMHFVGPNEMSPDGSRVRHRLYIAPFPPSPHFLPLLVAR